MLFFYASCVLYGFDYGIPCHQRLAAEEVDLKVFSVGTVFYKEVHSFFTRFGLHQHSVAAEVACLGKAVFASQVAVVGNVQAHSLDRRFHSHCGVLLVIVLGEEHLCVVKFFKLCVALLYVLLVEAVHLSDYLIGTYICKGGSDIVEELICQLVHNVNAAATYVKYNVLTVLYILMYHFFHWSNPFLSYIRRFSAEIFKQAKSSRIFWELCLLCGDPFYEKPLPYLREKSRGKGGGSPRYFLPSL